jgi:Flp pilus assembly pilin Flp
MARPLGTWPASGSGSIEAGATAVEYALFAALIAVVVAGVVLSLGLKTDGAFANLLSQWP